MSREKWRIGFNRRVVRALTRDISCGFTPSTSQTSNRFVANCLFDEERKQNVVDPTGQTVVSTTSGTERFRAKRRLPNKLGRTKTAVRSVGSISYLGTSRCAFDIFPATSHLSTSKQNVKKVKSSTLTSLPISTRQFVDESVAPVNHDHDQWRQAILFQLPFLFARSIWLLLMLLSYISHWLGLFKICIYSHVLINHWVELSWLAERTLLWLAGFFIASTQESVRLTSSEKLEFRLDWSLLRRQTHVTSDRDQTSLLRNRDVIVRSGGWGEAFLPFWWRWLRRQPSALTRSPWPRETPSRPALCVPPWTVSAWLASCLSCVSWATSRAERAEQTRTLHP